MKNGVMKVVKNQISFNQEAKDLIKKTVAEGSTDTEFAMFLYQAEKSGLDPLARQIYFVKRGGKTTIQASIDGLRLVAQRSGYYAGQDEPVFEGEENGHPILAKVTVYRFSAKTKGTRYPAAVGVAYWTEYVPNVGQDFMWKKMPHTMLAKVAEALALRKAFPQELSGIYSKEEMDQAGVEQPLKEVEGVQVESQDPDWIDNNQLYESKVVMPKTQRAETEVGNDCTCHTSGKFHSRSCPQFNLPVS